MTRSRSLLAAGALAVLLGAAAPASAEDWLFVGQADGIAAALDRDSVRTSGTIAQARMVGVPLAEDDAFYLMISLEHDCAARTYRFVDMQATAFDGQEIDRNPTPDADWLTVEFGAPSSLTHGWLCEGAPYPDGGSASLQAFIDAMRT